MAIGMRRRELGLLGIVPAPVSSIDGAPGGGFMYARGHAAGESIAPVVVFVVRL